MQDHNELLRYSRQIILDEVGQTGQKKLNDAKVLVVGTGGLGSPALYYLAAAGIGTLGIADFDSVGISNLQRQIIHFSEDVGKKKTDSAFEKLKALNPLIHLIKHSFKLHTENAEEIIESYDIVIDATDNVTARYLLSDCCYLMNKPVIEGAVRGFEGTLMTILPNQSPCYRCLYPNPPGDGFLPSCSETGIMGSVAGVIGSLQALEATKLLLNAGNPLSGRILAFNGLAMTFEEIQLDRNPHCSLCGTDATIKNLNEVFVQCKNKAIHLY